MVQGLEARKMKWGFMSDPEAVEVGPEREALEPDWAPVRGGLTRRFVGRGSGLCLCGCLD